MKRKIFYFFVLLVVTNLYACKNKGSTNTPPKIISVTPETNKTTIGNKVRFTCSVSDDGEESLLSFHWKSTSGNFISETDKNSTEWVAPYEPASCEISVEVSDGEFSDEYSFVVKVENYEEIPPTTVGVYYYPWYGENNFHGGNYLREHLNPVQKPELGEYNDRNPDVIKQHIEWCKYAGIGLWVCSWWGPGRTTDVTLKENIMKHPDLGNLKIALFYETSGRMPDFNDVSNVESDINYMAETYFNHPNYFKIEGKPVLFIYLTRVLSKNGILKNTVDIMRNAAHKAGFEIYLVGDQVFGKTPSSTDQLALLDAVTNYDVYGSSGAKMYATQEKVDDYYQVQSGWRSLAHQVGTSFIPATSPGFNDRGVRDGHVPLSRKLSEDDEFGSLFKAMVNGALKITDPKTGNLFMITSWNEWHEDTQIEPVAAASPTSQDDSDSKQDYTSGLEYEGYGMRYLDILKEALGK